MQYILLDGFESSSYIADCHHIFDEKLTKFSLQQQSKMSIPVVAIVFYISRPYFNPKNPTRLKVKMVAENFTQLCHQICSDTHQKSFILLLFWWVFYCIQIVGTYFKYIILVLFSILKYILNILFLKLAKNICFPFLLLYIDQYFLIQDL